LSLLKFTQQAMSDFQKTAAVAPSSRYLVQAMVEPLPLANAKVVVEFGPGTGAMTHELLRRMPANAMLIAFEISPRFAAFLRQEIRDPRLVIIEAGAETCADHLRALGVERVDAALSSLGLSLMRDHQVHDTLRGLLPFMGPSSVLTQYQYLQQIRFQWGKIERYRVSLILRRYFASVDRSVIWRNIPPAYAFACRK
jgi:phospholipid N-methyltransferase